jgi:hypothetical protein
MTRSRRSCGRGLRAWRKEICELADEDFAVGGVEVLFGGFGDVGGEESGVDADGGVEFGGGGDRAVADGF